jgi:polyisoprenoid-binding protein YceI
MKTIKTTALLFALASASQAQVNWNVDASHSGVTFTVPHMVISEVPGSFKKFDGKISSKDENFTDAQIEFTIDASSINTDNEKRDAHLKSDDFFNAEKFPQIKFKGKSMKKISGNKYILTGDLTIRDVTKTVELAVIYNGNIKDPYGNLRAGFKISGSINRLEFGLKWNNLLEAGGAVVGDSVSFLVNLELVKQK